MKEKSDLDSEIRSAALELFASKGYAATGIRDIARHVGVSTASLYHYMTGKDDLLERMMRDVLLDFLEGAQQISEVIERPEERVAALIQFHVYFHVLRRLETMVLDVELRSLNDSSRGKMIKIRDAYEHIWREAIERGLSDGVFHDIDSRLARLALMEMCTGVNSWFEPTGPSQPQVIAENFANLGLAMLDARRGKQKCVVANMQLPRAEWFGDLVAPS